MMIGTVSEGTLKPRDLINAFYGLLEQHASTEEEQELLKEIDEALEGDEDEDDEEHLSALFEEMLNILNDHAPPFTYVGGHEDDPACYGVWVAWDALDDATDVLKVHSLQDVPPNYEGFVLRSSEHDISLCYLHKDGSTTRHWSV